jgi:mono/diheme cytochrome c family protein
MRINFSLLAASALAVIALAAKPAVAGTPDQAAAAQQGKAVFAQWCAGCHSPMRAGPIRGPGSFPPAGTYLLQKRYGSSEPAALEQRTDLTPDLIRAIVRQGLTIMPPTRKSEVTDGELEAVIAYLTQNNAH